jgi:hypothetical protein
MDSTKGEFLNATPSPTLDCLSRLWKQHQYATQMRKFPGPGGQSHPTVNLSL